MNDLRDIPTGHNLFRFAEDTALLYTSRRKTFGKNIQQDIKLTEN